MTDKEWKAEHTVYIGMRLQKKTDADILNAIQGAESKQGEIKRLIRLGIKAEKSKLIKKYLVKTEFRDSWSSEPDWDGETDEEEIKQLSKEWCIPVDELMKEVEEI